MAQAVGIEPTSAVLETVALPLSYAYLVAVAGLDTGDLLGMNQTSYAAPHREEN